MHRIKEEDNVISVLEHQVNYSIISTSFQNDFWDSKFCAELVLLGLELVLQLGNSELESISVF
jgi:hypothetical protein